MDWTSGCVSVYPGEVGRRGPSAIDSWRIRVGVHTGLSQWDGGLPNDRDQPDT